MTEPKAIHYTRLKIDEYLTYGQIRRVDAVRVRKRIADLKATFPADLICLLVWPDGSMPLRSVHVVHRLSM